MEAVLTLLEQGNGGHAQKVVYCQQLLAAVERLVGASFDTEALQAINRVQSSLASMENMDQMTPTKGEERERRTTASDGEASKNPSKRRILLQPQREAPAPPSSSSMVADDEDKSNQSKKSPNVPVRPAPTPGSATNADALPVDFPKLKQWLKRHRLHKYASNFSTITYAGMLDLQDADLEGLGITAQGARTKMLKSIADLKLLNGQHEFDLAQIYKEMGAGLYSDAIQGLSTLFQLQNSSSGGFIDGPSPPGFNLAAAAMHVVHGLISELITNATHDRSQATADAIVALASFLDQAIRLEFFSVDQRSQLFSWKAEAETALMAHNPNIRPPPSSSSGLDARSKGFEPKWRSADPRTKEQDMDANGESVWGVPESNLGGYSTVARRAVKPTRTTRPYSTGSLFHIDPAGPQQFLPDANLPPDSVSLRSLSSLGSGDLFDPIWGQMGNGAAQETGSGELAFKADDHTTTGGDQPFQATDAVSGTSSAAGPIFMQQTTESEFQRRSWINDDNSARERSATDAGIPSFWGAEDENIQALTLSMTAILDDEVAKRHSVM